MADILIRGMEMPENCAFCPCSNNETRFCWAAKEYIPMLGRPAFCPLVHLPEWHGRLIDADELIADCVFPSKQFEDAFRELIGDAPTIVPAEGGGEDG